MSVSLILLNTEENLKEKKKKTKKTRKTRATMRLIKHRFLTLQELRMSPTGLVHTQGLQPGFLPSQIQIDLPLYCHYHFISHHPGLSARVLVTFLVATSKIPSLVPLDNLYPASFSVCHKENDNPTVFGHAY